MLVVVLVASGLEMRSHLLESLHESRQRLLGSAAAPTITLLAPAYNEALTVSESVRSLLTLSYPNLEVVVINDGSSDDTVSVLQRDFDLVAVHPIFQRRVQSEPIRQILRSRTSPGLVVVDKHNGGKADALNAGVNVASGELVCAIDADTIIESDALLRMVRPFLYRNDVVAAGGTIRVVNGSRVSEGRVVDAHAPNTALAALQAVEYLRAFLTGRLGWNRLGGNLIISGAFGLFRRDAMLAAGGYEHDTVGTAPSPSSRSHTFCSSSCSHPSSKRSDCSACSQASLSARCTGPSRCSSSRWPTALGSMISVFTVALEQWSYRAYGGLRDRLHLTVWAMVEGFGYRQLTTVWRLRGLVKYLRGKNDWGVMTRTGFAVSPPAGGD